jgi:hypothetical protein
VLQEQSVEQPYTGLLQEQSVPGGWGPQISRLSAHGGGKVLSPTHQPSLTIRKYSWFSFLLEAESKPRI